MQEYRLIKKSTLDAIGDATREMTGTTEMIQPQDVPAAIRSIEGGGSELVKTVTFMDETGTRVLYEKPTIKGDDCVDVVAKGLLEEPIKDDTAQYYYRFKGWSLTPGGAVDSNALKNVGENRVLYAYFNGLLQWYAVNFYDADGTILKSNVLQYGDMPSYEPAVRPGYEFVGWEPEITTVTGNIDYYAKWIEGVTFENATWDQIAEISESGQASNYFAVGDTKTLELDYGDGTTASYTVAIAGFNHDDLADGSGKAGMTIVLADKYTKQSFTGNSTAFKSKTSGHDNTWGTDTAVISYYTDILNYVPDTLKNAIKTVNKPSYDLSQQIEQVPSTIWPLSLVEVDSTQTTTDGTTYEYFSDGDVNKQCPGLTPGSYDNGEQYHSRTSTVNGKYWRSYYIGSNVNQTVATNVAGSNVKLYLRFAFSI